MVVVAGILGGLAWYMFYGGLSDAPPDLLVEVAEEPPSEAELEAALDRWLPERDGAENEGGTPEAKTAELPSGPAERGKLSGAGPGQDRVTEESILREYLPRFMHLERRVNASLDNILQSALADYRNGSGGKKELASKYLKTIRQLENVAGREFDALADRMRADLRAAALPPDAAERAEQEYQQRKKERREALLQKGFDML